MSARGTASALLGLVPVERIRGLKVMLDRDTGFDSVGDSEAAGVESRHATGDCGGISALKEFRDRRENPRVGKPTQGLSYLSYSRRVFALFLVDPSLAKSPVCHEA